VRLIELLFEDRLQAHLDKHTLNPGAGDPLALLKRARQIVDHQQKIRSPYRNKVLILDQDRYGQAPDRDREFDAITHSEHWLLVWQTPCHEACLLRHLESGDGLQPATSRDAFQQLVRHWPEYEKGMNARKLRERIGADGVIRAARSHQSLREFLRLAGVIFDR
jgi:hypothetical protein